MSLLEWLGERRNPGRIGTVDGSPPEPAHWRPGVIVFRGILAAALAVCVGIGIARVAESGAQATVAVVAVVVYCAIAYQVTPRPDFDNVGWAGGLIDHPFRWSDDVNRGLIFLGAVLWPGRFLTVSLRDLVRYFRGQRFIVLPPRR
jgi:hypothetical protein